MTTVNLQPQGSADIDGIEEVKVQNDSAVTAGKFEVKCPNVPATSYDLDAGGSRNIQIPVGTSTFTDTGTTNLTLTY
jgi:hypothetical protein